MITLLNPRAKPLFHMPNTTQGLFLAICTDLEGLLSYQEFHKLLILPLSMWDVVVFNRQELQCAVVRASLKQLLSNNTLQSTEFIYCT